MEIFGRIGDSECGEDVMNLAKLTVLVAGTLLVACGSPEHTVYNGGGGGNENGGAGNGGQVKPVTYETIATQVLPACTGCHGAGGRLLDLSSYEAIMAQPGLVVAGSPENSRLYTVVQQGIMPPRSALAPELQDLLFQFIAQGAVR